MRAYDWLCRVGAHHGWHIPSQRKECKDRPSGILLRTSETRRSQGCNKVPRRRSVLWERPQSPECIMEGREASSEAGCWLQWCGVQSAPWRWYRRSSGGSSRNWRARPPSGIVLIFFDGIFCREVLQWHSWGWGQRLEEEEGVPTFADASRGFDKRGKIHRRFGTQWYENRALKGIAGWRSR